MLLYLDSMTNILAYLKLPSFATVIHAKVSTQSQRLNVNNCVIQYLHQVAV